MHRVLLTRRLKYHRSVPLKQWAAGLVQGFHDLTSSLYSSMTHYLMIHQRSLYNHTPAGLLPRARILVSRVANFIED